MPMRLCIAYPRTCTSWNWFGPICLNPAPAISEFSVLENLVSVSADMRFVKNYTPLDFQAKNFAPLISLNINSLGYENEWKWRNLHRWHKIYTATGSDGSDKSHLSDWWQKIFLLSTWINQKWEQWGMMFGILLGEFLWLSIKVSKRLQLANMFLKKSPIFRGIVRERLGTQG